MKFPVIGFYLLLNIIVSLFAKNKFAMAQSIKVDGTTATQLENCPGDCIIKGGLQQGINLFHSFERFNVDAGTTVLFQDSGVNNIFGRVTGGKISEIFGTLGISGGNANLFLLNPNGIIFGPNSSLDVNGSFFATTANAIKFGKQGFFNAAQDNIPLLTINPSVLFFANGNNGKIVNESIAPSGENALGQAALGLRVPDSKSLLLVGGDVAFKGGRVNAFGGRVELGGLAEAGEIKLNISDFNESISLSFPDKIQRANIHLNNQAYLDVRSGDGGDIAINAENIIISDRSTLFAGIRRGLGTANSRAGNITLNTTKKLEINNGSRIANQISSQAKGTAGDININSGSLFISNFARIQTATFGIGDAGNVKIEVNNGLAQISSSSRVDTSVSSRGVGDAGNIQIVAKEILLEDGSSLNTNTFGQGDAGNIDIFVEEDVKLTSGSRIFSSVGLEAMRDGGQIKIEANNISLDSGSILVANTFGLGKGGNISLNSSNSVHITGFGTDGFSSGIVTATEEGGQGRAGNITVDTNIFSIADGAIVSSQTLNESDGGDILIAANTFEAVNGGQIVASADSSGNAGSMIIHADSIVLSGRDPNFANRLTQFPDKVGNEDPGNSGFFASSRQDASGLGGDIEVTTGKLNIQEGAEINVSAEGTGEAGNLTIKAQEIVLDRGILSAETRTGDKGSITLNDLSSLLLLNGSQITTKATDEATDSNIIIGINGNLTLQGNNNLISAQATDQANGGNVDIDADFIIAFPQNNDILASAIGGDGGKIQIKAESILGIEERNLTNTTNDINASSQFSSDGTISIETPDVNPASGLVELPDVPIDVSALLARNICDVGRGTAESNSSFINTGRGGKPPSPYEPLDSNNIFVDVELPTGWTEKTTNSSISQPATKPIVEANAWVVNEKGHIELVSKISSDTLKCGSDDVDAS